MERLSVRCQNLLPAVWHYRAFAALLILGAAFARVAFLAFDCPLDLAPDEAHYWDWSRRLDWSYYSKGPLVAWLIRASCTLFGSLSTQLIGNEMLAVRIPAVVCGSLLLLSLYVLTAQIYRRESLAAAVVALAVTFPPIAVGSTLMTIDAPYTCCWGWALVFAHRAINRNSIWHWLGVGVAIGIGILAKYTMVLFPLSLTICLLTNASLRGQLRQPGYWLMGAVAVICCLPIVIWNAQHDWVTIRHVTGLAGLAEATPRIHWLGPMKFIGTQFALLLGYWFVVWAVGMAVHLPWRESNVNLQYLWWMSAPMFAVFLIFSLKTGGGEPNWPITAYLSGLVLTAGWLVRQLQSNSTWYRRTARAWLATACLAGLAVTILIHRTEWVHPLLARVGSGDMPVRRFDPTCRLRGWQTLAMEVDRLRDELREQGIEPIIAGSGWALPGEIAFHCRGNPAVHSLGLALGDRHSQYDFWNPNPLDQADAFRGKSFIVVGYAGPVLTPLFERIAEPLVVTHFVKNQPVSRWNLCVAHGYKGSQIKSITRAEF